MRPYGSEFYEERNTATHTAAQTILALVQEAIPGVRSAIDIGCGVGTWLSVLGERRSSDVVGVDGDWVDRRSLVIPEECFVSLDLSKEDLPIRRRYDLVLCLEVAEHLPSDRAEQLVTQLTQLGDFVLFSAAVPGQEGIHHINEQWPEYWIKLFENHGYAVFDIIRQRIWTDDRIAVHYRQNTLLFVRKERISDLRSDLSAPCPVSIVHPDLYLNKLTELKNPTIRQAVSLLYGAIMRRVRRDLGRGS